jgi:signal transduction histidine kinase
MMTVVSHFNSGAQDVSLAHVSVASRPFAGAIPVPLEDFIHELRQPLGVIDSLAYYLELTATDEKSCTHLENIRAMVAQVNQILERASTMHPDLAIGTGYLTGSS